LRWDVLGIGENSWDRWIQVERLPAVGEKVPVTATGECAGGQIATALLGCAYLGLSTAYVGVVGDDGEGAWALAPLRAARVNCAGVQVRSGAETRRAFIWVDGLGARTICAHRDPSLRLRVERLERDLIGASALLLLDTEDRDAARWVIERAREAGVPVLLDAECCEPEVRELLRKVAFPIVSGAVAREVSAAGGLEEGLREFVGAETVMVTATLGARGAAARFGSRFIQQAPPPVDVLDTTGAGDIFRSCFAWALHRGLNADGVLATAVRGSALSCSGRGAQGHLPNRDDLLAAIDDSSSDRFG